MRKKKVKKMEKIVCTDCGKKFEKEESLKQHERDKHEIVSCKECGKRFRKKKALKNHVWFNHRNRRKKLRTVKVKPISNNLRNYLIKMEKETRERELSQELKPIRTIQRIKELPYLDLTEEIRTKEERIQKLKEERELGK